ncbi:MAG: 4Fe-4S binding protein [Rectinemataceae bacterium]
MAVSGGAIPPALLNLVSDRPVIEASLCIKCGKCVDSCPEKAITVRKPTLMGIISGKQN